MNTSELKKKMKSGKPTFGSWITLSHPAVTEIMIQAGFEWLVIDLEHSAISIGEAQVLIQLMDNAGIVPFVRVTSHNPDLIKRVLDAGAKGLIVPQVNSRQEAREIARCATYPPQGTRGVGLGRASGYGMNFEGYRKQIQKELILMVQIEHIDAVSCAEDILRTPGVDGYVLGPYDLSGSLGTPGAFYTPAMKKAIQQVNIAARRAKTCAGVHVVQPSLADVRQRLSEGYRFIALSLDTIFLASGARQFLKEARR